MIRDIDKETKRKIHKAMQELTGDYDSHTMTLVRKLNREVNNET